MRTRKSRSPASRVVPSTQLFVKMPATTSVVTPMFRSRCSTFVELKTLEPVLLRTMSPSCGAISVEDLRVLRVEGADEPERAVPPGLVASRRRAARRSACRSPAHATRRKASASLADVRDHRLLHAAQVVLEVVAEPVVADPLAHAVVARRLLVGEVDDDERGLLAGRPGTRAAERRCATPRVPASRRLPCRPPSRDPG